MTFYFMFRTLLLACLLSAAPSLFAQSLDPLPNAIQTPTLKVEMLNGEQPMELTIFRGYRRATGRVDQPYSLRLSNLTDERVWVAIAIDDINPRTGERATQGQPGFIIDPGQSRVIEHQKNKDGQRPLTFSKTEDNKPGKIAMAIFRERMDYPHSMPWNAETEARVGGSVRFDAKTKRTTWLPPSGASFRKMSLEPEQRMYFEYQATE